MAVSLKVLGLALVVACALTSLTTSAASATDKFTATESTGIATGTSENIVFKITSPEVKVECTTSIFRGTFESGSSSLTLTPQFLGTINVNPHTTDCGSSIGQVTFDMNGCDYELTGNTTGSDSGTDATIWITCPTSKKIELTNSLCKIKVPAQTPTSGGVTYTNQTENGYSVTKVTVTSTGVTYSTEGAFCALGGLPSHGNNTDITGTVILGGYKDESGEEGPQFGFSTS
jgi:hypothetical protein